MRYRSQNEPFSSGRILFMEHNGPRGSDVPSYALTRFQPDRGHSFKEIRVGAGSFKEQHVIVNSVNQEPVGLNVAFPMVVPVAGQRVVPVGGWKRFAGLEEIDDGLHLVEILAPLCGEAEVALKPSGRLDKEQGLETHILAEMPETFVGRKHIRFVGFGEGGPRGRVGHRECKRNALVQGDLSIKEADGFGFAQAEAIEDLQGLLFEGRINAGCYSIRHGHGRLCSFYASAYVNCRTLSRILGDSGGLRVAHPPVHQVRSSEGLVCRRPPPGPIVKIEIGSDVLKSLLARHLENKLGSVPWRSLEWFPFVPGNRR